MKCRKKQEENQQAVWGGGAPARGDRGGATRDHPADTRLILRRIALARGLELG